MLIAAALLLQATAATPAAGVARMTALFDQVCLKAFPDDAKVDAAMVAAKAIRLTDAQAQVTLRDDPGRGWVVKGGGAAVLVMLELPPYHACSVRGLVGDGLHDLAAFTRATDAYKSAHPGFAAEPPFDGERGGIRIHTTNEVRALPGGGTESLMVIAQTVIDAKQLGAGETASPLRFVHQIRGPK